MDLAISGYGVVDKPVLVWFTILVAVTLQTSFLTPPVGYAHRAVSFMTPFGGYKRSGQGRESGQEAIKEFMQVKSVWIAQQTTRSNPFIMQ